MTSGAAQRDSLRGRGGYTQRVLMLAATTASLLVISAPLASAATITVSSTNDSGPGSLRQAIAEAGSGDTIVLPASATHYAVTSAE